MPRSKGRPHLDEAARLGLASARDGEASSQVTEALFTFVAIDGQGGPARCRCRRLDGAQAARHRRTNSSSSESLRSDTAQKREAVLRPAARGSRRPSPRGAPAAGLGQTNRSIRCWRRR